MQVQHHQLHRLWVNQPSTKQPFHHLHGTRVLGYHEGTAWRVYLLAGDVISQLIPSSALSAGWPKHLMEAPACH